MFIDVDIESLLNIGMTLYYFMNDVQEVLIMKYRLLNILACPICKSFPLELYVFKVREIDRNVEDVNKVLCELYCGYRKMYVKDLKDRPCAECMKKEIVTGLLYCSRCGRWYPIEDGIPRMLPDTLRDYDEDIKFLLKYRNEIPEKILKEGEPYNISTR